MASIDILKSSVKQNAERGGHRLSRWKRSDNPAFDWVATCNLCGCEFVISGLISGPAQFTECGFCLTRAEPDLAGSVDGDDLKEDASNVSFEC